MGWKGKGWIAGAAGVSIVGGQESGKVWLFVYRMLADFNQAASEGGLRGNSLTREMVPGHHGGSTRTITGVRRGAPVPQASLYVCLYTWSPAGSSSLRSFFLDLAPSLSSRANTSRNHRFYGPPSTFNEGTLRGGILF